MSHSSFPSFSWLYFQKSSWNLEASFDKRSYRSSYDRAELLFQELLPFAQISFPRLFSGILSNIKLHEIGRKLPYEEFHIRFYSGNGLPAFIVPFSAPEPKAQVHYCDHTLSVVRSSLTFHIFDFSSETSEQNSTKLDRKQELNILYQVCVFRANRKNKMAALTSDWLRHFRLLLWNHWTEFNETWHEARSQRLLPSLCFSGWSEKQDGRPGLWLAETFRLLL